jgi:hypothetical protein
MIEIQKGVFPGKTPFFINIGRMHSYDVFFMNARFPADSIFFQKDLLRQGTVYKEASLLFRRSDLAIRQCS